MNVDYYYEVGRAPRAVCGVDTHGSLEALVRESTSVVNGYISRIDSFTYADCGLDAIDNWSRGIPVADTTERAWIETGWLNVGTCNVPNSRALVDAEQLRQRLLVVVEINTDFLNRLSQGIICAGDVFIGSSTPSLMTCIIIDGTTCPRCDEPMKASGLAAHQAMYMCPIKEGQKKVLAAKYKKILNPSVIEAVRGASNIPSMMVPEMFGTYAPQWVHDAIDTYGRSGYADLSLQEFLGKLSAPEV